MGRQHEERHLLQSQLCTFLITHTHIHAHHIQNLCPKRVFNFCSLQFPFNASKYRILQFFNWFSFRLLGLKIIHWISPIFCVHVILSCTRQHEHFPPSALLTYALDVTNFFSFCFPRENTRTLQKKVTIQSLINVILIFLSTTKTKQPTFFIIT